jgi:hypothetical protein
MSEIPVDAGHALETIRGLMERARQYRHPPAPVGFVAGLGGVAGGVFTHQALASGSQGLVALGIAWGAVFLVSFAAVVFFTRRAALREGTSFWSPLAVDVIHALWPSLVAAFALSGALVRAGHLELVAPVWLLAYGVGGVAAGSFASSIVRWLGVAFLAAGILDLVLLLPPGLVLAATFGGFHLVYGVVLAVRGGDGR